MAVQKKAKVVTKRRKFIEVDMPIIRTKTSLIGNSLADLKDRTITMDLTRQLRGKSIELSLRVKIKNEKAIAIPKKIKLMPYFIRRMIRKRISYVEDSFTTQTQESLVKIKPFLITRKKVSRAVRKTLRNLTKNWLEDYLKERKDEEIFNEILSNRLQKPLSLKLKKTYPLSLCEIRIFEVIRSLKPEEIPKKEKKKEEKAKLIKTEEETSISRGEASEKPLDISDEEVKDAEKVIKETQKKASELEGSIKKDEE